MKHRFEVMPMDDAEEEANFLPRGVRVSVTASPNQDIERTVSLTENLCTEGLKPIPHITARQVRDEGHLYSILNRFNSCGVDDVFVIGGDKKNPVGEFDEAMDALVHIDDHNENFTVGIGAYPEGHHIMDNNTEVLENKLQYADYVSTQICYDSDRIVEWLSSTDALDNTDVLVGVPGVVELDYLQRTSERIGVGDSVQRLNDYGRDVYYPDDLIADLMDTEADIQGFHINTFNRIKQSVNWVEGYDRLELVDFQ